MSKRNKKNKPLHCRGIEPTKERKRQFGSIASEAIYERSGCKIYTKRYYVKHECTIDFYLDHSFLTPQEGEAAMKFRHAYLRAVLHTRVDDVGSGSHGNHGQAAMLPIVSERILREAYSVLSNKQKAIVVAVCGHDEWTRHSSRMNTLRRGLARLIEEWGIA